MLSSSGATATCSYTVAGQDTFTVPAGVVSLNVTAVGAAGGKGDFASVAAGSGASVQDSAVPVTVGHVLTVVVGGTGGAGGLTAGGPGGTPGGGGAGGDVDSPNLSANGDGGGGGGYSGLLVPAQGPLVIAGGGGGTGGNGPAGGSGDIGQGGSAGGDGVNSTGGGGGTSTGGGAGGVATEGYGGPGTMGTLEQGGQGGASGGPDSSGGGGGGGYYGGGGGGGGPVGSGGGGGSSYGVTGLTNEVLATGPASVTISYTVAAAPTVTITTPASGASYTQGQVVDAGYSCSEGAGGPGLSGCAGTVADGSAINTQTTGTQAFSVTATSNDGLSTTDTVHYTVASAAKAATTITPEPQVILPGFSGAGLLHVSATLTSGKTRLAGKTVAFTVKQTKLCSAQTNTDGVATCSINVLQEALVLLTNSYTASFSGDSSYTASTASTAAVSISSLHGLAQTRTRHNSRGRPESALQALSAAHGRHAERLRARIKQILRREHH